MRTGRVLCVFSIALLFVAPASAQWTVHTQKEEGGTWEIKPSSERQAIAGAGRACGLTRNGVPLLYAAKAVSPSGEETVFQCGVKATAPSEDPDGRRFIERCPQSPEQKIFADCQCAVDALRAMSPEPPPAAGKKKPIARAMEACPADKAHIEREFYVLCLPGLKTTRNDADADAMCRCQATSVASGYLANPDFGGIDRLRSEAMKSCWINAKQ